MPSSRSRLSELERLGAVPFAHRGLHGAGLVENSGGAIAAAVARGFGVELDVQLSRDGEAMVFHDYELDRLTAAEGPVAALTAAELQAIRLNVCNEAMPRLPEALTAIAGRVPLIIEVKSPDRRVALLCAAVAKAVAGYGGPVGIMSFNPEVGGWFARNAPAVLRGLVVTESGRRGL
ncbi:MAG TPA: glycerophosphodiester phosphodiesterase family protein, partial [Allosphingosinicella sp.]|nr:glycerophosphodiester phosphodiesterase family protein [Allosphingosinicella sp.]